MYSSSLVTELKKVVSFRNYWDLTEIPDLGQPTPESGQYYQSASGAIRLDYISSLIQEGRTLTEYLDTVETDAITEMLNRVQTEKNLSATGKYIAKSDVIFNVGRKTTNITNNSRFCGVAFELVGDLGLMAVINKIGLYLTAAVTDLDLYLFHSSQAEAISTYTFTSTRAHSFSWQEQRIEIPFDDLDKGITGGMWYLGYYQDDLALQSSQAVQYTAMNWVHGYCNSCGQQNWDAQYKSIYSRLKMSGFYVPSASLPVTKTEAFEPTAVVWTSSNNWGFNLNVTIACDLTQFFIDNRIALTNPIKLAVAMKILEMMKYSSQINNVEEAVKIMIIRDLEGAQDTKNPPLNEKLADAIESLNLDMGNVGKDCIPCARKPITKYGAIG